MRSTILKLAAVAAPLAMAAVPLTAGPAQAAPNVGTATVTPNHNLIDGQVVQVVAGGFPQSDTQAFATQCGTAVVANNPNACDQSQQDIVVAPVTNGTATFNFTVHAGKNFHATDPSIKCDTKNSCLIVVADAPGAQANQADFGNITFGATTKTKATASKKSVKLHKSVTITAKTTHTRGAGHPTGKVIFKDNGKKFASKKETASGKVSIKHKFKVGKHKITATYNGDTTYLTSTGKVTVKVHK